LMQISLDDRVESPSANDLMALRTDVHGEKFLVPFGIVGPMACDLWGQGTCGPCIHDIRIAHEAVRSAAHRLFESWRRLSSIVHGKSTKIRQHAAIFVR